MGKLVYHKELQPVGPLHNSCLVLYLYILCHAIARHLTALLTSILSVGNFHMDGPYGARQMHLPPRAIIFYSSVRV